MRRSDKATAKAPRIAEFAKDGRRVRVIANNVIAMPQSLYPAFLGFENLGELCGPWLLGGWVCQREKMIKVRSGNDTPASS